MMEWLIAHLIGDFLLQNDWMANGKKTSSWICAVHTIAYMIPFLFITIQCWQITLIAIQHFLQDRSNIIVWSLNVMGKGELTRAPMTPWSVIVIDNIWHIIWIYAVMQIGA